MITIYFKDALYFSNESVMPILLIICCLLIPISLYVSFVNQPVYKNLDQETKECILSINRLMLVYTVILLLSLVYRFSYMTDHISIMSDLTRDSVTHDSVMCGETLDCCTIYDNCRMDGNDTHIYTIKKGTECRSLNEMISDHIIDNDKIDNCLNSQFGCCYLMTTCDSFSRDNYTYDSYEEISTKGFPHGYVNLGDMKLDEEGTNCYSVTDLLQEKEEQLNSSYGYIFMICICMICLCMINPYSTLRDDIKGYVIQLVNHYNEIDNDNEIDDNSSIDDNLSIETQISETQINETQLSEGSHSSHSSGSHSSGSHISDYEIEQIDYP